MLRRLDPASFRRVPWANGLGLTTEIARADDENGALLWRVSIADVVEEGPFSPLPGIDRTITLIEGEGFDLDCGEAGGMIPLDLFVPVSFSGDWATAAINVRGPSRDLNVMTARGRAAAAVAVLMPQEALEVREGQDGAFGFCLGGHGSLSGDAETFALDVGDVIDVGDPPPGRWSFAGGSDARFVVVSIREAPVPTDAG